MYYHYPYTGGSAYVLWKRLISKRKTGISRIAKYREKYSGWETTHPIFKFYIISDACSIGDLSLVMVYMTKVYNWGMNELIRAASWHGHLHIVKWLYRIGCDPTTRNYGAMRMACSRSHLRVAKFLHSVGCDASCAISYASSTGNLSVFRWLYNKGCNPKAIDESIVLAKQNGKQNIIDFLMSRYYHIK